MPVPEHCGELRRLIDSPVMFGEPMHLHTSWRIGGPADIFVEPLGIEDLKAVIAYARNKGLPLTIIGAGTNLLVRDGGISGIVVKIAGGFADIRVDRVTVTAGGGAKLHRLAKAAREAGLGGLEFIAGIPGSVGGAVVMNAGAYGFSVGDRVREVTCLDLEGNLRRLDGGQMEWGYRKSVLQGSDLIVVEAVFGGFPRDRDLIAADMEKILGSRKARQPLEYPSAGSVFKNPPGNYAGRLIQESGCPGMRVGDAQVSTKHANFIVNLGRATASDVLGLIAAVQERVLEKFGVSLEMEVKVLGRD
ncbi:MAG: UDP-N-acetylmuramate dehydrogenase [Peptococcaceae bacterium]|nr:UDP-N-acetylmuramate dehydrogenase [Peptococcaceae bacterium]